MYTNKKSIKGDLDGVFMTENLTKYRTEIVKRLSQFKFHRRIYTYWTSDSRIYVKKLETSRKQLVTNFEDIENNHVAEGHKGKYRQLHSVSYQLTEKQTVRIDPINLNTYTFLYTCQIHIPKVWKKTISILNCRLI